MNPKVWICLGALSAAASVGWGAYHAHGLENLLLARGMDPRAFDQAMHNFDVAVRYQGIHAIGMVLVGLVGLHLVTAWLDFAAFLFALGTLLFSASMETATLLEIKLPWFVVPAGGLSFILGWMLLAIAALQIRRSPS